MSSPGVLTNFAIVVKRRPIAAEGDERHVLLARPFDLAAADDPLRIREEHDLQQQSRRIRRRAGRVVPKAGVEVGQIDGVVELMIQGMLERPGQQLAGQIHGDQLRLGIDGLVAGHDGRSTARRNDTTFDVSNTHQFAPSSVSTSARRPTFPTASLA
jgi:hypothetical protein